MKGRIEGYDLARAVAIVFMVLINFQYYLLARPSGGASEVVPRWIFDLPSGRSSSLFVTLAGCGVSLMSRGDVPGARKTLLVRALVLIVAGNVLILAWEIDILHFYAVYLTIAALVFLRLRSRWLLLAAGVVSAAAGVGAYVRGESLRDLAYWSPAGMTADVFLTGVHPVFPWLAFVLIGMCIGRLDLSDPGVRRRLLLAGASATVIAELLSMSIIRLALLERLPLPPSVVRLAATGWSPDPLFVVSAAGTATCTIALAHAVAERFGRRRWARALVATGQLAFTLYVVHAMLGAVLLEWLFDAKDALSMPLVIAWWILFVQIVIVAAYLWRRRFARGPLEWLMRRVAGAPGRAPATVDPTSTVTPLPTVTHSSTVTHSTTVSPPGAGARAPAWIAVGAAALPWLVAPIVGSLDPALGCGPPLTVRPGDRVVSELTLLCPHREITLENPTRSRVELATQSAIDPYLVLLAADQTIEDDDDSGPSTDARIVRTLAPGRYVVRVRPFGGGVGPFALTVASHDVAREPHPERVGREVRQRDVAQHLARVARLEPNVR